jgi:hypothetical protein
MATRADCGRCNGANSDYHTGALGLARAGRREILISRQNTFREQTQTRLSRLLFLQQQCGGGALIL